MLSYLAFSSGLQLHLKIKYKNILKIFKNKYWLLFKNILKINYILKIKYKNIVKIFKNKYWLLFKNPHNLLDTFQ